MKLTRRNLLAGAAAAAATSSSTIRRAMAATGPETRIVPSTGARVPAVGLGTWITFNVGDDPALLARSTDVMRAFFEEGGGMIDSSPMYGSSQTTVGHGLQRLGYPDALFSAEKVWTSSEEEGPEQIAETRRKWGVPKFDLLQVHNLAAAEAHLETLFAMRREGALDHVGVTTSHGRRHRELEGLMTSWPLDFVQLTYNAVDREAERRLLPLAREKGIAVIANRPFRRGALIDRVRSAPLPSWAADIGASAWASVLLKFILSNPAITVAIPATTRPEHVRENKAAARGVMPDPDLRQRISAHVRDL